MTTPPRPDQEIDPPPMVVAPGGVAGVFKGRLVIVFGPGYSGVFVYSPTPGTGNLIASIAGAAGTDPYGNTYPKGIASQQGGIEAILIGSELAWDAPTDHPSALPALFGTPSASGNQIEITTGEGAVSDTPAALTFYDSAASAVVPAIPSGQPGIFVAASCPIVADTWHSLGSPSATGFSSDYGRYRMSPEGEVEFDIQLSSAGGGTGGNYTYANTLPTAYRPVNIRVYPLCRTDTAPGGQFFPCLQVHASGAVQIQVPGIAAGNQVGGQAFMPLD